jgi:Tfp pilus assembly protein PilF
MGSVLLLFAAVLFTFSPALRNRFVDWDDQNEIYQNPDFNPVTLSKLAWNWRHTRLTLYMPVTYAVWGGVAAVAPRDPTGVLQPAAFHALNLVLHCAASVAVLALLWRLGLGEGAALLGALVFAVHPLQTEAIVWASGMYTMLSSALCLAAILLYLGFSRSAYGVATGTYALALLVKAAAVATPLMAAVLHWTSGRRSLPSAARRLWLWILLAAPLVVAARRFQDLSVVPAPPWWGRPIVALDALGWYLRKIALPVNLCPDYGRTPDWVMAHLGAAALSGGVAVVVIAAALAARRRAPWLAAGVGLLVAGTLPYAGLSTFDFQYVSTVADRYAYLGMAGVAVVAAGIASRSRFAAVALLLAIPVCATLSWRQATRWHDTVGLFDYTLAVNPRSLVSQNVLGYLAQQQGRPAEAERRYQAALQIWPADAAIHFNLGNLYRAARPDAAVQQYELAVRYQPHSATYRNNYGVELARLGRVGEAIAQLQTALQLAPGAGPEPHVNLGLALALAGNFPAAAEQYRIALQMDPSDIRARAGLASLSKPSARPATLPGTLSKG